jgi:lipopolysaccharide export system protein LptA
MATCLAQKSTPAAIWATLAGALLLTGAPALAQSSSRANPVTAPLAGLGADSKEPIKIEADRLDVLDKESRAIYAGNVVAVQGKTTIRCSRMTILYDNRQASPGQAPRAPAANGDGGGIRRLECDGPVTVTSDDQVATGQKAVFDRERDLVVMTGDVALAKGPNVTRGERMVYNMKTGIANIEGGRVRGFFVPGSTDTPAPAQPRRPGAGQPTN